MVSKIFFGGFGGLWSAEILVHSVKIIIIVTKGASYYWNLPWNSRLGSPVFSCGGQDTRVMDLPGSLTVKEKPLKAMMVA